MKEFKVISPKGFFFGGKLRKKGETFDAENKSALIQTGLHFKQIEDVAEAEAKAAAAAAAAEAEEEAKRKAAEADPKGKK